MNKIKFALPVVALLLSVGVAHAQGGDAGSGCDSSPENPTIVLSLLGSAGAAGALLRARIAARRHKKQ